jgi:phage baseplate assembly protein V
VIATSAAAIVTVGGVPLPAVSAIRVQERLSAPSLAEITVAADDASMPAIGAPVIARAAGGELFRGEVAAIELVAGPDGATTVRIRAFDALDKLRRRSSLRAHVDLTAVELARELTGDLGLAIDAERDGPAWPRIVQSQSDFAILVETAERAGLYLTLRDGTLKLVTLAGQAPPIALTYRQNLFEARLEARPVEEARPVLGWNPAKGEAVNGVDGPDRPVANAALIDADHAAALGEAAGERRAAGERVLWGVAEGDSRLRPGAQVLIDGVAAAFAGRYVLTAVTHTIDRSGGFLTEIDSTPPSPRWIVPPTAVALGIVSRVDDPDGLGRVRVTLPAFGEVETEWLQVLTAAAGRDKGIVALPDGGDRVLAVFPDGDPARGIVLGGLYGPQAPPVTGVVGGAVRRFTVRTPEGGRLVLDDDARSVVLEDPNGSLVELTPDRVRLRSAADLEIEAPGKAIVIRGQTVDFQQG